MCQQDYIDNISAQLTAAKENLDLAELNWRNMDKPPVDLKEALDCYEEFLDVFLPPCIDEARATLEGELERLERLAKIIRHWLNFEPPVELPKQRKLRIAG